MGAGAFLESAGRFAYAGSFKVTWPGEFGTVMLRIERSYDAVFAGLSPEMRRRQAS